MPLIAFFAMGGTVFREQLVSVDPVPASCGRGSPSGLDQASGLTSQMRGPTCGESMKQTKRQPGVAELQIRWPNVPVVFCETRQLTEGWTYRFLAAAHVWAITEHRCAATYLASKDRRHRTRSGSRSAATEQTRGRRYLKDL